MPALYLSNTIDYIKLYKLTACKNKNKRTTDLETIHAPANARYLYTQHQI